MKDVPTPPEAEDVPKNKLDACIIKVSHVLSLLFIFTVFISFYEVLMRYVFDAPTTWVHETASFIGGSLFVIGGIYAFATDKHVRVVLIYDAVSNKTRRLLNIVHHIVGLTFSLMMAWAAYTMVQTSWFTPWGEFRLETSGSYFNPPYPALLKALIFVIFCILSVQFVLHLFQEIKALRSRHDV
ncbi:MULTISPECIES: TRAP transporter small permease subunit [Vibrio]|uniref:TRAP transporter small permease protein n=1 Tax=Vibrio casei TaxID=673372 RepID=A0A368LNJ0_9VIBR|nr:MULTISPECIES: TRAP transporter small permease subunit [Vibrio]RCS73417.1 TRAP transporter small permease [Vibrio casei]SJN24690.1 Predicted gluconate TRAP family transporter, DctQ subunit [Vibrio casei]HBV75895.1 C4-dicarboxylate ABC transporter permease [Vibrio sp.]